MYSFIFIGGTKRGYELLSSLIRDGKTPLHAFVLKEDEHETELYSEKISDMLNRAGVSFRICKKLSAGDYEKIKSLNPDIVLVFGWRSLFHKKINTYAKTGVIVSHFSLLPAYRGFAPLQWAIINGEKETGVTLFKVNDGAVDTGDIVAQERVPILPDEYAIDVDKKLTDCAIRIFHGLFEKSEDSKLSLTKQNESNASYTCKRVPEDGKIDWSKTSEEVYNFIRALASPFTGAFCSYNEKTFHIRKAKIGDLDNKVFSGRIQGRVVRTDEEGIEVLCGAGTVKVIEWECKEENRICNPNTEIKSVSVTLR
jgi:methionyl-tRNA formyltransferase